MAANPAIEADRIGLGLGVATMVRVKSGEIPAPACMVPDQPPLEIKPLADAGGFAVSVPVAFNWPDLSSLVTEQIKRQPLFGGETKSIIRVDAESVEMSAHGADVQAKLAFNAGLDTFFGRGTVSGYVYALAKPRYNEKRQILMFENLRLTEESGAALKESVGQAIDRLLMRFIGDATIDLTSEFGAARRKAEEGLTAFGQKVGAEVNLDQLRVDGIEVLKDTLTVLISAAGSARVDAGDIPF